MFIDPIDSLGYRDAPTFVPAERLDEMGANAHLARRIGRDWALRGVYLADAGADHRPSPVLYVVRVSDVAEAREVHRATWNQGAVPFLLAESPQGVWLYTGFDYAATDDEVGRLEPLVQLTDIASRLETLSAAAIDSGRVWRHWSGKLNPERRVDRVLLTHLEKLSQTLISDGLSQPMAHALIGKFIYLRYLFDRGLLHAARLEEWGLSPAIFGRSVSLTDFIHLIERVEGWLNGSIFPIEFDGPGSPSTEQFARVAATFLGDDPTTGQAYLDLQAYDFSFIPIELLSSIYEQFLSEGDDQGGKGAWYTPLPVVDFMLDELHARCPLSRGMRVLDPACGSGAFLVQCYRLLITEVAAQAGPLSPTTLKSLMEEQIFGVDRDLQACRVAVMSLALALLDAIETETLSELHEFRLPTLLGKNILHRDFFDEGAPVQADWIVGNPPWLQLKKHEIQHAVALRWLDATALPAPKRQAAEAFAWRCLDWLAPEGVVSLLLPSMSLYQEDGKFRKAFLGRVKLRAVSDFTNLREVLFAGRARHACAALTFDMGAEPTLRLPVFSPWVLNQEANRPAPGRREAIWQLSRNTSEVFNVRSEEIAGGSSVPWKLVRWGGWRLGRTLKRISRRFPPLWRPKGDSFCRRHALTGPIEGLQLRSAARNALRKHPEALHRLEEVVGELRIDVKEVRDRRTIYAFPTPTTIIADDMGWVREGRDTPLAACRPPHVLIGAARNYFVYSDDFLVFPPRQIGLSGPPESADWLKALSIYLSSRFVRYFELVHAPQLANRGRSTLKTLKRVPVPLDHLSADELAEWAALQEELAAASAARWPTDNGPLFSKTHDDHHLRTLEGEVNQRVNALLGLTETEVAMIDDVLSVYLPLADGKLTGPGVLAPGEAEQLCYAETLKDCLDSFIGKAHRRQHQVEVVTSSNWGAVRVFLADRPAEVRVLMASEPERRILREARATMESLRRQWIYFERNLFVHRPDESMIGKPMQQFWWTRSQAIADADTIIATALSGEG